MKLLRTAFFLLTFTIIDLAIYTSIYLLYVYFDGSYSFSGLLMEGLYALAFRVFSLQVLFQVIFIAIALSVRFQQELSIIVSAVVAFAISILLASNGDVSAVWQLLQVNSRGIGEGFAIIVSVLLTIILFKFTPGLRSLYELKGTQSSLKLG